VLSGVGQTIGLDEPETSKEYALVTMWDRTYVVDISNPRYPAVLGSSKPQKTTSTQTMHTAKWKDVKVVGDVAYFQ
jgi:hypothetical protein